jgi:hypothetical protein
MGAVASLLADNPFHVLELPVTASRMEIERAGQKWLSMLEIGVAAAASYPSPLGPRSRTPEAVRMAMAELRDPDKRVVAEMLLAPARAGLAPPAIAPGDRDPRPGAMEPWPELAHLLGRRPRSFR